MDVGERVTLEWLALAVGVGEPLRDWVQVTDERVEEADRDWEGVGLWEGDGVGVGEGLMDGEGLLLAVGASEAEPVREEEALALCVWVALWVAVRVAEDSVRLALAVRVHERDAVAVGLALRVSVGCRVGCWVPLFVAERVALGLGDSEVEAEGGECVAEAVGVRLAEERERV